MAANEHVDVVVVGGGQAGIATSEHLTANRIEHVVLERHRTAESWRTGRWDSLVANGPAWHDRFPNMAFADCHPDSFPSKERVADYFESYAKHIAAPLRNGVNVHRVSRNDGSSGFVVETDSATIDTEYVVVATGPFQRPVVPSIVPADVGVVQLHSNAYRNPQQLPGGATLVVGGGSSGAQIADELLQSGRRTFLSLGAHGRPPRRYRGRDFVWWLGVLNKWDAEAVPGSRHTTIAVSGADGGNTVDFRQLAHNGLMLLGTTREFADGALRFADDLSTNLAAGDADYLALLDEADAYVVTHGLDLPAEPDARRIPPDPDCVTNPRTHLDISGEDVTSIIWATGYRLDFSWLHTAASDPAGRPVHHRGISAEPGIYFVGLPWQTRRGSSFIWGVWYDAKYIVDHIAKQRAYVAYQPSS